MAQSNVPGSPVPEAYGEAHGDSLEQGLSRHQVQAQPLGTRGQPGSGDTFHVDTAGSNVSRSTRGRKSA